MNLMALIKYATIFSVANFGWAQEIPQSDIPDNILQGEMKKLVVLDTPKILPDLIVQDFSRKELALKADKQKVLLINFWATWCLPCIEEMPSLNAAQEKFKKSDLSVITVASGRNRPDAILRFFEKNGITNLSTYLDPKGKLASALGVYGLPTTIVVTKKSEEIARLIGGADWNSREAIRLFEFLLESP